MMARCPSCGGQVDDNDDACPSCGWDFETRQRRPGGGGKPPEAKKPPVPEKPAEPHNPPAKDAGRGLKQFPKIEPGHVRQPPGKNEDSPFAIPSFGKEEAPAPPAKEPPARAPAAERKATPSPKPEKKPEPQKERFAPTPLAAELEEAEMPEPPKTAMRKVEPPPAKASKTPARPEPPKKKPAPVPGSDKKPPMGAFIGLASAAVLLISGAGIYMLTRSGESSSVYHRVGRAFEEGSTGAKPAAEPPASPGPSPLEPVPIKPVEKVPEPAPEPAPPAPVSAVPKPQPKPKPVPPPPPAAAQWKFQGTVYDLITLNPVSGAKMFFQIPGGKEYSCQTDARGRFKISLDPLPSGSYTLAVSHKEYLDGYIDETSPPLAEAEVDERRAIAASNARNDPWIGDVKKTVRRDFYVIPYNLGKSQ